MTTGKESVAGILGMSNGNLNNYCALMRLLMGLLMGLLRTHQESLLACSLVS
jgi:hypothetical protein